MRLNTTLWTEWLSSNPLSTLLSGGILYLYDGPVQSDPDAALDVSCTLLMTVTLNGDGTTGLTFSDPAVNGALSKPAAAVWKGTPASSGTPTQFRWCFGADTGAGAVAAGASRMCGSAGIATGDPNTTPEVSLSAALTAGNVTTIDSFTVKKPA